MNASEVAEQAVWIDCGGDAMLGIHAGGEPKRGISVLILTGGPQYRAGSHRQFTLLTRRLAAEGYGTLRFDVRGMGDSTGEPRSFTELDDDIDAALRALAGFGNSRVVILGLCDAASATLLYLARRPVPSGVAIAGLVLMNPWVRSVTSLAQAELKHYYGARLLQRDFWRKVVSGKFDAVGSLRSVARSTRLAFAGTTDRGGHGRYQDAMADGLRRFDGPGLLITSGNDLTAREFLDYAAGDARWSGLLQRPKLTQFALPDADHTFSTAAARDAFELRVVHWLAELGPPPAADQTASLRGPM